MPDAVLVWGSEDRDLDGSVLGQLPFGLICNAPRPQRGGVIENTLEPAASQRRREDMEPASGEASPITFVS